MRRKIITALAVAGIGVLSVSATANAVGRTLFALMASGADFDPHFEAKRAAARKAGGRAA